MTEHKTHCGAPHQDLLDSAKELSVEYRDGSPPVSRHLTSNGIDMHYLDWGSEDKPPILFLHGGRQSSHTWDMVCLGLRDDYHCIALDLRGHGESGGLFQFGVDEPRLDIEGAVKALGLKNFVLAGMSMGGSTAVAYAGRNSEKMAGLVVVDITPVVSPEGHKDNAEISEFVKRAKSLDEAVDATYSLNPRGSRAFKRYAHSYCIEENPPGSWRVNTDARRIPPASPAEFEATMERRREQLWIETRRISCPCLVVHGAESRAQSAETIKAFCDALPDPRPVTIPGASHYVQEDQPRALIDAIRQFMLAIGM